MIADENRKVKWKIMQIENRNYEFTNCKQESEQKHVELYVKNKLKIVMGGGLEFFDFLFFLS